MEIEEFKNRECANPKRKKIKIISQSADEIIADIENAEVATQEGTPINAENMNKLRSAILELDSELKAFKNSIYDEETNTYTF